MGNGNAKRIRSTWKGTAVVGSVIPSRKETCASMRKFESTGRVVRPVISGTVILLACAGGIAAQENPAGSDPAEARRPNAGFIEPGARVRLTVPGVSPPRIVGTVVETTPTALRLSVDGSGREEVVPLASVKGLEVSRGRKRGSSAASAAGLGLGAVVGLVTALDETSGGCDRNAVLGELCSLDDLAWLAVPLYAGAGWLVGWGVGKLFETERWKRVEPGRFAGVRVVPGPDGAVLTASFRF